jgi:hypothetical protein
MFTTDDGQRSQAQNGYTIIALGVASEIRNNRISDEPVRPAAEENCCPDSTVLELFFD